MRQHHWSQGLFLLGLAALTAALVPACGGGGGSAGATPQSASAPHAIYASSVAGLVVIPASSTNAPVRSVTFTPANPNDIVLYVVVEGSYSNAVGSLQAITVTLTDASGNSLGSGPITPLTVGTSRAFRWRSQVGCTGFGTDPSLFPSTSYVISITAVTSAAGSAQIDSTKIKMFMAENVTVDDPSAKFN